MPNLYVVTVKTVGEDRELRLNFTTNKIAKDFVHWVSTQKHLEVIDESPAYQVEKTLKAAIETMLFWAPKPPPKMVERINLMSGKPYMEAEDTPGHMSPSQERYWSM